MNEIDKYKLAKEYLEEALSIIDTCFIRVRYEGKEFKFRKGFEMEFIGHL